MPCEWLKGPDGAIIHINRGRGGKRKPCPFCKRNAVSKLCDFPIGDGKTCDAEVCDSCSRTLGHQETEFAPGFKRLNDTIDVCPNHRGKTFPKKGEEPMPEHYSKNTVSATVWCAPCGKPTPHRIDDGRRGPCLVCLEKPPAARGKRPEPSRQATLFGGME